MINAVICELNPMHLGHKHVFDEAKSTSDGDSINIAVMSGNFTQRSTPAIFDKYTRAEAAVKCGADIVVELPFPWCSSGVEDFALGGVTVAAGLGAERLVFGSEQGDAELLLRGADVKSSPYFAEAIKCAESEKRELGSAVIFDSVMSKFGITNPLGANDKLGIEYIRFGREAGISEFRPIKRLSDLKSATELRQTIFSSDIDSCKPFMPEIAAEIFENSTPTDEGKFDELLFNHARLYSGNNKSDVLAYTAKVARDVISPTEFIKNLPTKKYTAARLRRELLFDILGVNYELTHPLYTVLLAMNQKGREYLSDNKKKLNFAIITKPSDTSGLSAEALKQYEVLQKADELYALCSGKTASEYIKKHPHVLP